jgi:hypothetical protein
MILYHGFPLVYDTDFDGKLDMSCAGLKLRPSFAAIHSSFMSMATSEGA